MMPSLNETPLGKLQANREAFHGSGPITDAEIDQLIESVKNPPGPFDVNEAKLTEKLADLTPMGTSADTIDPSLESHVALVKSAEDHEIDRAIEGLTESPEKIHENTRLRELQEAKELIEIERANDEAARSIAEKMIPELIKYHPNKDELVDPKRYEAVFTTYFPELVAQFSESNPNATESQNVGRALLIFSKMLEEIAKTDALNKARESFLQNLQATAMIESPIQQTPARDQIGN